MSLMVVQSGVPGAGSCANQVEEWEGGAGETTGSKQAGGRQGWGAGRTLEHRGCSGIRPALPCCLNPAPPLYFDQRLQAHGVLGTLGVQRDFQNPQGRFSANSVSAGTSLPSWEAAGR